MIICKWCDIIKICTKKKINHNVIFLGDDKVPNHFLFPMLFCLLLMTMFPNALVFIEQGRERDTQVSIHRGGERDWFAGRQRERQDMSIERDKSIHRGRETETRHVQK